MTRRVLHVCGDMRIGGAERAVFQLARAQIQRGDQVGILTSNPEAEYARAVRNVGGAVHSYRTGGRAAPGAVRDYLSTAAHYDIVHFHLADPVRMLASLRLNRRTKVFYTHRGGRQQWPAKRRMSYAIVGLCARHRFDGVSGNTIFAATLVAGLFRLNPSMVEVTYNGVDFNLLMPERTRKEVLSELQELDSDRFRIGTAANLRPWKRTEQLLYAVKAARIRNAHCYILGDGPSRPALEQLARTLSIVDRVSFLGTKRHVGDYLQIFDTFVLPSDSGESFGNAAVEAMGVGIPTIVMSDGGGLPEHVVPGGGVVVQNVPELATQLEQLSANPELRRSIGSRGRAYVRSKYTYDNAIKGYDRLYRRGRHD